MREARLVLVFQCHEEGKGDCLASNIDPTESLLSISNAQQASPSTSPLPPLLLLLPCPLASLSPMMPDAGSKEVGLLLLSCRRAPWTSHSSLLPHSLPFRRPSTRCDRVITPSDPLSREEPSCVLLSRRLVLRLLCARLVAELLVHTLAPASSAAMNEGRRSRCKSRDGRQGREGVCACALAATAGDDDDE